jgi:hypothetical protein
MYRRQSAEGEGEEQPVAMKLSNSGWAATLDLNRIRSSAM